MSGVTTSELNEDEKAVRRNLVELKERRKDLIDRRKKIYDEFEQLRVDLNETLDSIKKLGRSSPMNMNEAASILEVSRQRLNQIRKGQQH